MKINEYCRVYEALNAIDSAIRSQLIKFDPKVHLGIMQAVFKDAQGEFDVSGKQIFPTIHKHWPIPLKKRQLSLVFYYLRKKKFDYELKLLYNNINLSFPMKVIIILRSYTWTKKQLQS